MCKYLADARFHSIRPHKVDLQIIVIHLHASLKNICTNLYFHYHVKVHKHFQQSKCQKPLFLHSI